MVIFGSIFLFLIFFTSLYFCAWPSPSAIFSVVWFLVLFVALLNGDSFQEIDGRILSFIILLSLIALLFDVVINPRFHLISPRLPISVVHLNILTAIFIILIPVYYLRFQQIAAQGIGDNFLFRIRYATTHENISFGLLANIILIISVHAVVCFQYRYLMNKFWAYSPLVLAFSLQFFTASRTGLTVLLLAVFTIYWLDKRRLSIKDTLIIPSFLSVIFIATTFILGKSSISGEMYNSREKFQGIFHDISIYSVSGIVAFSKVLSDPNTIAPPNYIWRNMLSTLRFDNDGSSGILPYVYIPDPTNIYTIFLPYFSYGGWMFSFLALSIILFALCLLFRNATNGNSASAVIFAFGIASLAQSPTGDSFLVGFSFWIQTCFYIFLVIVAIPQFNRRKYVLFT